jgi:hypothetical protein
LVGSLRFAGISALQQAGKMRNPPWTLARALRMLSGTQQWRRSEPGSQRPLKPLLQALHLCCEITPTYDSAYALHQCWSIPPAAVRCLRRFPQLVTLKLETWLLPACTPAVLAGLPQLSALALRARGLPNVTLSAIVGLTGLTRLQLRMALPFPPLGALTALQQLAVLQLHPLERCACAI